QGNFGNIDGYPAAAMRYCVAGDTRVATSSGTLRIDQIHPRLEADSEREIGLEVLDRLGRPVTASKIFHSGDHPTLRLGTSEGFELTGTHNHPVLCLVDMAGVPLLLWKLLEEIRPGDHVLISRPRIRADIDAIDDRDEQLALLLGMFVSEGWASETRAGFNNTDAEYFASALTAYDAVVVGARYSYERTIKSGSRLHEAEVQDLTALRTTELAELIGLRSAQKRVPERVWTGTKAFKRRFLQALFTGDGSSSLLERNSIQVSYSTRSKQLAHDVPLLLLEFGIIGKQCRYEKGEIKVVLTNRRDARIFAREIGFLGAKQEKLERHLEIVPRASRALSRDRVPFVAEYVRSETDDNWLRKNNIDRVERWERGGLAIMERIESEEVRTVVKPLTTGDYYYATVASVEDAGVQAVYSLRVDT